ncbi:phage tail protein [Mammaliicoccus sciuri]|uniref:phage tail protein n=1 Tax=Mammaliicoccus sciuri TaxID=1296 RepID=UPI0034DD3DD0
MSNYILVVAPEKNLIGSEGYLVAELKEGEYNVSNELKEKPVAGKMDYDYSVTSEEYTFTNDKIPGDKGQEQFLTAIKKKEQIRVWRIEKKKYEEGYKSEFAYTVVEEYGNSFDDEEDTIEVTLKVKFNTAKGVFENLPASWLDPSAAAPKVEFEKPGEWDGKFEEREQVAGSGA